MGLIFILRNSGCWTLGLRRKSLRTWLKLSFLRNILGTKYVAIGDGKIEKVLEGLWS
jgi:hypothetical protein